ncbi:MAG: tetratricopeptide repeat protein [Candidatus Omnitrophica bacterium]|nr:tetratricopeptide repeat protein [Candidatus Omnitrophota bacterium]
MKTTRGALLFLIFFCMAGFFSGCTSQKVPGELEGLFESAGEYYKKGDYPLAIEDYEKILNSGYETGNLYYNVGNSYFKQNMIGKAIVNYKRALRLQPRDGDVRSNYKFAFSTVKRNVFPKQKIFVLKLFDIVNKNLTTNEVTIVLSLVILIFMVNALLYVSIIPTRRFFVLSSVVLILIFLANAYFLYAKACLIGKEAVVIQEAPDARFEPFPRATTHFTLYEGEEILVIERMDSWCKIKRVDGKIGWVKAEAVEVI